MAKHLVDAGFDVTGYDPFPKAVSAAKKNGVKTAKTVAATVKGADVVCSSLPKTAIVQDVYLGAGGALKAMRRGAVCFELSTSSVGLAKQIAAQAKKKEIAFLDAPVSGSVPHLERKGVSTIVGGDEGRPQGTPRRARRLQQVRHVYGKIRKRPAHEAGGESHRPHPARRYGRGPGVRGEGGTHSPENDEVFCREA